jgi:hypothetical protein
MSSNIILILNLLNQSKDQGKIHNPDEKSIEQLSQLGITADNEGFWILNRVHRINLALKAVSMGATLESVVKELNWKDFEGFVAEILTENSFHCVESFRRRGTSRIRGMEIDVIGVRGSTILSVDAKMWAKRSGKASALKSAAENQRIRTRRLGNQLDKLADKLGGLKSGSYSLFPLLVTWLVEEVEIHDGVPVIPVFKLNSFILNLHNYEDMIARTDAIIG